MTQPKRAEWVLRVTTAMVFLGHGVFALNVNPKWIPFITHFGFSEASAQDIMPVVGVLDIALAAMVLIRPIPAALLWMTFWGLLTALLRPLTGASVFDFIERGANWGAPAALLLLRGLPKRPRDWFR